MSMKHYFPDSPSAEAALEKSGDYTDRGLTRLREILKDQYVKAGEILSPRVIITLFICFLALYLVYSIAFLIIGLPIIALTDISSTVFSNIGLIFAIGTLGYIGWGARSDIKDRKQTYRLMERPNPDTGAKATEYLDARDETVRANALQTIADAVESNAGKVVKQSSYDVNQIVAKLIDLLNDDFEPVRANSARALHGLTWEYPGIVLEHREVLKTVVSYPHSTIRSRTAVTLGLLGNANPEYADEFAQSIVKITSDDDPEVRIAAAIALGGLPSKRATEELQNLTNDPNPEVRQEAAEALQQPNAQQPSEQTNLDQNQRQDKQTGTEFVQRSPDMDFADIAGMESLKRRLEEQVLQPFSDSQVYEKFGVGAETGILFHGPPGTGKTHIAQCLAGELGANYINANVGDLESKWIGEGVENIKQMFAEARQNQPCLIFIDEIDAIATDRSSGNQHNDKKKMVNQLLQELSNIETNDNILVVAATNRPADIDDAMLRPGRFDSKIEIPKPDEEARWKIFQHHMEAPHQDIERHDFVSATSGFTASDIKEITRRTARKAAGRERKTGEEGKVTTEDVYNAIEEIKSEQSQVGQYIQSPPALDFTDVVGMKGLKEELNDKIIDPLENPEQYQDFGLGVEHGFLFYGPPGTGKTYISKCLAGELSINYIEAKGGDLVSKWIGEGTQNVQKMFAEARQNQPCLIFIDEIDALATDRSGHHQSKSERQMVNQFLEELSTINDEDNDVIVIGATNRPNDIDDAMLRTGRLGEKIEIPAPDAATRVALFKAHLNAPTGELDENWIAEYTDGFVASDMEQLATEAARNAMRRMQDNGTATEVTQKDIQDAVQKVTQ